MRLSIIAVGTRMPDWITTGFNEYAKRLPHDYRLEIVELASGKRGKGLSAERAMQQEADAMLKAIPANDLVIALAIDGQNWNTERLAKHLLEWHDAAQNVSFLIGGPDGLSPTSLQRANLKWSLSALTFPHPLVRVILAEQIYRAWSLQSGHPYHR